MRVQSPTLLTSYDKRPSAWRRNPQLSSFAIPAFGSGQGADFKSGINRDKRRSVDQRRPLGQTEWRAGAVIGSRALTPNIASDSWTRPAPAVAPAEHATRRKPS